MREVLHNRGYPRPSRPRAGFRTTESFRVRLLRALAYYILWWATSPGGWLRSTMTSYVCWRRFPPLFW